MCEILCINEQITRTSNHNFQTLTLVWIFNNVYFYEYSSCGHQQCCDVVEKPRIILIKSISSCLESCQNILMCTFFCVFHCECNFILIYIFCIIFKHSYFRIVMNFIENYLDFLVQQMMMIDCYSYIFT